MNANIKIVWFEDEDATVAAYQEEIENIIKNYYLKPDIQRYRNSEFDLKVIDEADLILADYDLGTASETNIEIMQAIRDNKIVVDALLYSSHYQLMISDIQKVNPLMEGVYCAKRGDEEFWQKLNQLIYRLDKRSQSIENLRGVVMEYTSIFDRKIYDIIIELTNNPVYMKLTLDYINNNINKSKKENVFKSCEKNKTCSNCDHVCESKDVNCSKVNCCYASQELVNLDSLMGMELYTKSRILDNLLKNLEHAKEFIYSKDFHKKFNEELIIYRNALAHEQSTDKKLYIQARKKFIDINEELFKQIRTSINSFIDFFDKFSKSGKFFKSVA